MMGSGSSRTASQTLQICLQTIHQMQQHMLTARMTISLKVLVSLLHMQLSLLLIQSADVLIKLQQPNCILTPTEGQLPELAVSSSDETADREAESDNDELDRVSLAEVEQSNPFQIQSIEHDQNEDTSSSAKQAVDAETFSTGGETSSSQQSADTQTQAVQDNDLTFDQALAQATAGDELSDDPNETSGNDSKGALTFDEALAATKGTESITDVIANSTQATSDSDNSTSETPVLDSLLPSAESVSDSLSTAFGEADDASSLTASSSNDTSSSGVLSGLASSTVSAVSDKLSEATEASESLLQKVSFWFVAQATNIGDALVCCMFCMQLSARHRPTCNVCSLKCANLFSFESKCCLICVTLQCKLLRSCGCTCDGICGHYTGTNEVLPDRQVLCRVNPLSR